MLRGTYRQVYHKLIIYDSENDTKIVREGCQTLSLYFKFMSNIENVNI
jgi:hypothetical protein